jgi:hypothetical protein
MPPDVTTSEAEGWHAADRATVGSRNQDSGPGRAGHASCDKVGILRGVFRLGH